MLFGLVLGAQYPLLDRTQFRAGLGAQLVDEGGPRPPEQVECLRLLPGAGQGQHQPADQSLVQGVLAAQPPQFGEDLGVPAERQVEIHAPAEGLEIDLL